MIKILLSGWFIIRSYSVEDNQHSYLVEEPVKNMQIAFNIPNKLSYNENAWIKLQINAECEVVFDNPVGGNFFTKTHICTGSDVVELKCTEKNSLIINGIHYC